MSIYRSINNTLLPVSIIILGFVYNQSMISTRAINSTATTPMDNTAAIIIADLDIDSGNDTTDCNTTDVSATETNITAMAVSPGLAPPFPTDCPPAPPLIGKARAVQIRECADNCDRLCRYKRYLYQSRRDFHKRINGCRKSCSRNRCRLHSKRRITKSDEKSAQHITSL
ncbi:unnamed protein product [Medioppia subpectinata]|uniref:Uncharacterized protein n=1 Tax=Medioppia subpectinata TaxID=1979941 RepID=A0A7R9Q327_9ACAR|nr:unnamed protein product [Medioppia subpectinata]CAG2110841.1 unnamed protein product [Medioppia subpectinata]